jgi:hypothetical protein
MITDFSNENLKVRIETLPPLFKRGLLFAIILLTVWFACFKQIRKAKRKSPVADYPPTNGKRTRITLDELRSCKGFQNIGDEEGEYIIDQLQQMSVIFYGLFMKHKKTKKWKRK